MVFQYLNAQYTFRRFDHRRHRGLDRFQSKWEVENGLSSHLLSAIGLTSSQVTRAASGEFQRDLAALSARGSEAEIMLVTESHWCFCWASWALHCSGCALQTQGRPGWGSHWDLTSSPMKTASFSQPLVCSHFLHLPWRFCLWDGVHSLSVYSGYAA